MTTMELVQPAHLWIPERVGSYGDEAIELLEMAGRKLDPEQKLAVDARLSFVKGGRWAALEGATIEPRQNGKTTGIETPIVFFDLFLMPPDRIAWTAHLFKTAQEAFADHLALIGGCPALSKRVRKVANGKGEEGIYLKSGASIEYLARTAGGGRGLGGKRVVFDEALFLRMLAMAALRPTLAARIDPQIDFLSSAGVGESDQLRALMKRGRAGGDRTLTYCEWKMPGSWREPTCERGTECTHVPGIGGCALDDEANYHRANPALGRRNTIEFLRGERGGMPPHEFGREYLGWEDDPAEDETSPIDVDNWAELEDPDSEPATVGAFGIAGTPDRAFFAIALAGYRADGLAHVEVVEHLPGNKWIADRLNGVAARWPDVPKVVVWDKAGPVRSLVVLNEAEPEKSKSLQAFLEEHGWTVRITESAEMADACEQIVDAVKVLRVKHGPQPELDIAVAGARPRPLGDGRFGFGRRASDVDIAPLEASALALWASRAPYDPLNNIW